MADAKPGTSGFDLIVKRAVQVLGILLLLLGIFALGSYLWGGRSGSGPSYSYNAPTSGGQQTVPSVPQQPTCDKGFQWYPDLNACKKMLDRPILAQRKAGCVPGSHRDVPDPNNPGRMLGQDCGF